MTKTDIVRPQSATDEVLEYLDELRESGVTNMFGAATYIDKEFLFFTNNGSGDGSGSKEALAYWMQTFPRDKETV